MRRALAVSTLLAIAAFSGGCSSPRGTSNSNTNATTAPPTATAPNSAPQSSGPTVGGARPPQAKPSPTSEAGIKPPTKNQ